MVSKTRKQRMKKKETLAANGGVMPAVVPSVPKSIHLKKTRPHMKGKKKIRLGLDSPVDIYTGFEDKKGVLWRCPKCRKECRAMGFCVDCATGVKHRSIGATGVATSAKRVSTLLQKSKTVTGLRKKLKLKTKK